MDAAVLALRTVLALVVVVGLVVVLGRVLDDRAAGRTQDGVLSRLTKPFRALLPGGSTAPRRRRPAPVLTVVGRQGLGPKASVAVVDVGDQRLVLGVTEAGVTLLTSMEAPALEPEQELVADAPARTTDDAAQAVREVQAVQTAQVAPPAAFDEVFAGIVGQGSTGPESTVAGHVSLEKSTVVTAAPETRPAGAPSPVAGSVLSPATWRQAVTAVQSRTRR